MEIWKKMWVGVFFWTQCSCQTSLSLAFYHAVCSGAERNRRSFSARLFLDVPRVDWLIDWAESPPVRWRSQSGEQRRRTSIMFCFKSSMFVLPFYNKRMYVMYVRCDRERFRSVRRKKSGEHWSTIHNCRTCEFGPTQVDFFGRLFHPLALAPQILTRTIYSPRLLLAQTTNGVEVP